MKDNNFLESMLKEENSSVLISIYNVIRSFVLRNK